MMPIDAEDIAAHYMEMHGLTAKGWTLKWNTMAKRLHGQCRHREKRIVLNFHWVRLNDAAEVTDTILHEIAHALTPGHGHDNVWKAKCREIGARPETYDRVSNAIEAKWKMYCDSCERVIATRHRKTKISHRYCLQCGPSTTGKLRYID